MIKQITVIKRIKTNERRYLIIINYKNNEYEPIMKWNIHIWNNYNSIDNNNNDNDK